LLLIVMGSVNVKVLACEGQRAVETN